MADIGGTFACLLLATAPGMFEHTAVLRSADDADFHAAVSAHLASLPGAQVLQAAVAMASPIESDSVRMTHHHWQFSTEQLRERLGLQTLVVNDSTALAMAPPRLRLQQRRRGAGFGSARPPSSAGPGHRHSSCCCAAWRPRPGRVVGAEASLATPAATQNTH